MKRHRSILQRNWKEISKRKEGAYFVWGKPRYIHNRKLYIKVGTREYTDESPTITEQYVRILRERNIRIVTRDIKGNVWFNKYKPCYVVIEDRNNGEVYSSKGKLQFTKISGGWILEGNFILGKGYKVLPFPVPFCIKVSRRDPGSSLQTVLVASSSPGLSIIH